jgi:hypothetical protein
MMNAYYTAINGLCLTSDIACEMYIYKLLY